MNLETIAKLSGVSRSTVSRVINHSPNVRPEVRERVLQVLRETNFQPNAAARGLAAGSTRVLGLVIPLGIGHLFSDPYFPLLIQGVSAACNAADYSVMLWLADPEYERRTMRQILHSGLIDGVVVASIQSGDPLIEALLERSFPFVSIGQIAAEKPIPFVDVDNVSSARQAVEHLLGLGRRRVATIAGPQVIHASAGRLEGYRQALEAAGLPFRPEWVVEGDFTQEGGYRAMQRLLEQRPDAVFAASDALAQGALRAIGEAGLRVPEDIALVGFDDLPFAAHLHPPLTTVRQPIEQLGRAAVDMLVGLLSKSNSMSQSQILPTELVVRASSGSQTANRLES